MVPRSGTNLDYLRLLLSSSPNNVFLFVALTTVIYIPKTQSNHHDDFSYSECMLLFHISAKLFQGLPHSLSPSPLPLPPGILPLFLKKYAIVMAVYFSNAHYVLDQSHQLNSHRQSNNYLMVITFHHWWPGLHSNWLFCDALGLITDILKYAALLKLLCAWLWR